MLDGLAVQTRPVDASSTSATPAPTTPVTCWSATTFPLRVTYSEDNLGERQVPPRRPAGVHAGHDRIWLMDDDVVPVPTCLEVLLGHDEACLAAVREDVAGRLVEKAAVEFDLRNPLMIRPKRGTVESTYASRKEMPELVELQNIAFEGFMFRRELVDAIGLPDASYFIFYDDVDYAGAPGAPASASGECATRSCAAARLRPAARPRRVEGVLHVPEPLRRALPLRRERPGPAQALGDRPRGRAAQPAARGQGRGRERRPGAAVGRGMRGCRAPIVERAAGT